MKFSSSSENKKLKDPQAVRIPKQLRNLFNYSIINQSPSTCLVPMNLVTEEKEQTLKGTEKLLNIDFLNIVLFLYFSYVQVAFILYSYVDIFLNI